MLRINALPPQVNRRNLMEKVYIINLPRQVLVDLLGVESSANVVGTSLIKSSDHLDNFITISHLVENCKSNQFFKSVYHDCSSGSFCRTFYSSIGGSSF